jgi:hypothetical protein
MSSGEDSLAFVVTIKTHVPRRYRHPFRHQPIQRLLCFYLKVTKVTMMTMFRPSFPA